MRGAPRPVHLLTTAGAGLGRGHLSRTLTIAETLAGHGATVSIELAAGRLEGEPAARAARIGIAGVSAGPSGATVVVDLPDLAGAGASAPPERLVVFDDRDAFDGEAAIVIQPSMPAWRGAGRAAQVLAGFGYAPVARDYVALRDRKASPPTPGIEVIICFGGSDPALVTPRIARGLAGGPWRATIVIGADYAGSVGDLPPGAVRDPVDLPARLARADLAVIGAGTMKLEVACLGRPAILLAVADDQLASGPAFASTGAAAYLGDGRTIEPEQVRSTVRKLIEDGPRRAAMALAGAKVVDGRGAERIAAAILSLPG